MPAASAEADTRPGEETARERLRRREKSANEEKCQTSLRAIVGTPVPLYHKLVDFVSAPGNALYTIEIEPTRNLA